PGGVDLHDLARDGLEGGAVVNGGLDHEDLVIERIEPDEPYHLGVQRLPAVGDQDDLDVVDVEHRGGAEAAMQAARHWAFVDEAAVGERAHHARHAQGRPVPAVDLAAYLQGHGRAHSRLDAFRDGARIPQAGHYRRARAYANELAQDLRAVTGRAAARVVGHVGEHDGLALGGEGLGHRVAHGERGVDELVAMRPRGVRELIGEAVGESLVTVRDDIDSEAGVGDVGEGKAGEDGEEAHLRILPLLSGP